MTPRLASLLALLCFGAPGLAGPPGGPRPLAPETVLRAQDALRYLGFELTLLERDILHSLKDADLRDQLRLRVNAVQISISGLERAFLPGGKSFFATKRYVQLDHDLHELLEVIQNSPSRSQALSQSGKRLAFVDTQLGGLLAGGGEGGEELFPVLLRRQGHALEEAATDLSELVKFTLPADAVGLRVRDNARRFRGSAGSFSDNLDVGGTLPEVRKQYGFVSRAWQRLAWDINSLPEPQAQRLLLAAQRVDHIHDRLSDLLKVEDAGHFLIKEGDDKTRQTAALLQGAWHINSIAQEGKLVSKANPNSKIIFSGNRWFRQEGGDISTGGVFRVVDTSPGASRLELTPGAGPSKGKPVPVLVRMEGNLLRYAHFLSRPAFPTTFASVPGDAMISITWRREE